MASNTMSKKGKGKKASDPNETSKLLAAKISQLEQDAAGEKDQEAEIGRLPSIPGIIYSDRCLLALVPYYTLEYADSVYGACRTRSEEGY